MICVAQCQFLRTNSIKYTIHGTVDLPYTVCVGKLSKVCNALSSSGQRSDVSIHQMSSREWENKAHVGYDYLTEKRFENTRPDITLVYKSSHKLILTDLSVSCDENIAKIQKYQSMSGQIREKYQEEAQGFAFTLGFIFRKLSVLQDALVIPDIIWSAQMSALFGTAHGLRKIVCP